MYLPRMSPGWRGGNKSGWFYVCILHVYELDFCEFKSWMIKRKQCAFDKCCHSSRLLRFCLQHIMLLVISRINWNYACLIFGTICSGEEKASYPMGIILFFFFLFQIVICLIVLLLILFSFCYFVNLSVLLRYYLNLPCKILTDQKN